MLAILETFAILSTIFGILTCSAQSIMAVVKHNIGHFIISQIGTKLMYKFNMVANDAEPSKRGIASVTNRTGTSPQCMTKEKY